MGKTGIFAVIFNLQLARFSALAHGLARKPVPIFRNHALRRQNRPGHVPEPPEIPTRNLWNCGDHAPKRLISETNVFNLTDQDW
jgi:hypothetical protein